MYKIFNQYLLGLVLCLSLSVYGAVSINITEPLIIPSGLISSKPLMSDSTFNIISKKTSICNKNFSKEDLRILDIKFKKVVETLKKEHVFERIAKIAPKYGVLPEAVAACIIGEHVFNVSVIDKFQNYYLNIYSRWVDKHNRIRSVYLKFLREKEIAKILETDGLSDYEKFDTILSLYNKKYRGRKGYPNHNFTFSFFNPYGAGLTYGLGQLSPVRVLLTNDIAVKKGGLKKISPGDTESLYYSVLDVDTNINYVAASVYVSVENYKLYSNFDISNNIGVIATLYNLGDEKRRAQELSRINEIRQKENKEIILPSENFYGWYINRKEADIKLLFKK